MRKQLSELEAPVQQRKLITNLFTDIVASTKIVKHLDPENTLETMESALKRLVAPVEECGGMSPVSWEMVSKLCLAHQSRKKTTPKWLSGLACNQVLKANQDPRAPGLLTEAYDILRERATKISDEELRYCFLNKVAANWEIVDEFEISGLGEAKSC